MLPVELTHAQAGKCLQTLRQGLSAGADPAVVVDASGLQHFDSTALAVLLEVRREALLAGRTFSVRGLTDRLAELAALYGVSELLPEG